MKAVVIYRIGRKGEAEEACRLAMSNREIVTSRSCRESAFILSTPLEDDRGAPVTRQDGVAFLKILARYYSGSFLRASEYEEPNSNTKTFCPTGPGGGVDPHCSPGGGSGKMITSTAEAANAHVTGLTYLLKSMEKNDPERHARWTADDIDMDEIKGNWARQYRKRSEYEGDVAAFTDLDPERKKTCQQAMEHNAENHTFQAVVKNGPPLNVVFMRPEKNNGANGEYKGGVVRIYDKWTDLPHSDEQGIGTAVLAGGVAGTIRHEYGHALHEAKLTTDQRAAWQSRYWNHVESIKKDVSGYAAANADEFFAETFAMATHPKYNPNSVSGFARESAALLMDWVK